MLLGSEYIDGAKQHYESGTSYVQSSVDHVKPVEMISAAVGTTTSHTSRPLSYILMQGKCQDAHTQPVRNHALPPPGNEETFSKYTLKQPWYLPPEVVTDKMLMTTASKLHLVFMVVLTDLSGDLRAKYKSCK